MAGTLLATMPHQINAEKACFSPNGQFILTIDGSRFDYYYDIAKLWNLQGNLLATMLHMGDIQSASFSADGNHIVTASDDKTAKIWDLQGNIMVQMAHEASVGYAVFSPDGSRLITTSYTEANLWNLRTDLHPTIDATCKIHHRFYRTTEFSPDGSQIIISSENGYAVLWSVKGSIIGTMEHEQGVHSANFSSDGSKIITTSGKNAKIWYESPRSNWPFIDITLIATITLESSVGTANFSPDGNQIVTTDGSGFTTILFTAEGALKWLKENNDKVPQLTEKNKKKFGIYD